MSAGDSVEREFTVHGELGLHARPASRFVTTAIGFESEISIGKDGEWVSGKSVLSILSLAAGPGSVVRVRAEGPDAERAVAALGELLEGFPDAGQGI
jgi:phosphocarrier protein